MKKYLALLLAIVFCFGCFAACGSDDAAGTTTAAVTNDPNAATLAEAMTYLQSLYKDAAESTPRDYDMPAKVMIGTTQFTVTWKASVDTITIKESSRSGFWTIDIPDVNETETKYVLTATVKDSAGKTQEISFNRVIPVVDTNGVVTEPKEGEEYKLFMTQVTAGKVLYAIAETQDGKYLKTTDDASKAIVFKVEVVDGGYKFYTEIDGAKNYVYAYTVPYEDGSGKMSKYLCYSTDNASVWSYQQNVNAWFTTCEDGTTYVIGTYSSFETFCISESTYINATNTGVTQFPAELLENGADAPDLPAPDADDPAADSTLTVKEAIDLGASKISDQYTAGKYYVTGVITEVYNDTYGNMKIADSEGNVLTVYGTYSADGSTRYDKLEVKPVAGDTVKIYGIIGQYNDTPQIKNGWIVEHTPGEGTDTPDQPDTNEQGGTDTVPATLAEQLAEAAKLSNGAYLSYESTITGTITDAPQASSYTAGQYKFTVSDGTNSVLCYYTPVTGGTPEKGDTVTVTGKLTAFNGTAQFDSTAAATVTKTSGGDEVQQPDGATVLSGDLTDGMQIVIVNGANKKALSSDPSSAGSFYQKGADVVISGNTVTGYGTAEIWTVVVNGDGSYSFKQGDQKIGMQASYASMGLGYENDKWTVTAVDGGYNITNVARGNTMEWYADKGNWSTYNPEDIATNPLFVQSIYVVQ
ncbi:MAG: OB-fold nucleic acid binding domain-containing protein [Clostridia bacterium]|nr:OB-fold nucleic acid binding domain-containing protein [Clostridia bacterium]